MRFISTVLFVVTAKCCVPEILHASKKRRKKDKVVKLCEWVLMTEQTSVGKSFQVVFVEYLLADDLKKHTPVVAV